MCSVCVDNMADVWLCTCVMINDFICVQDFFLAKPMGVFSILDEQSNFPKATDDTFVMKLNQQFGKLSFYKPAKGTRTDYFGITHYAGHVSRTLCWTRESHTMLDT